MDILQKVFDELGFVLEDFPGVVDEECEEVGVGELVGVGDFIEWSKAEFFRPLVCDLVKDEVEVFEVLVYGEV